MVSLRLSASTNGVLMITAACSRGISSRRTSRPRPDVAVDGCARHYLSILIRMNWCNIPVDGGASGEVDITFVEAATVTEYIQLILIVIMVHIGGDDLNAGVRVEILVSTVAVRLVRALRLHVAIDWDNVRSIWGQQHRIRSPPIQDRPLVGEAAAPEPGVPSRSNAAQCLVARRGGSPGTFSCQPIRPPGGPGAATDAEGDR
jgi:hypothetical protein